MANGHVFTLGIQAAGYQVHVSGFCEETDIQLQQEHHQRAHTPAGSSQPGGESHLFPLRITRPYCDRQPSLYFVAC